MDADRLLLGLGQGVRELRAERGWTLKDLAARSGVSLRFLVQVESGKANISVRRLADLARERWSWARYSLSEWGR